MCGCQFDVSDGRDISPTVGVSLYSRCILDETYTVGHIINLHQGVKGNNRIAIYGRYVLCMLSRGNDDLLFAISETSGGGSHARCHRDGDCGYLPDGIRVMLCILLRLPLCLLPYREGQADTSRLACLYHGVDETLAFEISWNYSRKK